MKNKMSKFELICFPIFGIVMLILDQITKLLAYHLLPGQNTAVEVIKGFFYFTYTQNLGGAWSMFEGQTWLFILSAFIAIGILVYLFIQSKPQDLFIRFGLIRVASGAIGNCLERLMYGYVRDFLDFILLGYDFPIFNIADVCIVIGILFILLDTFKEEMIEWKQSRKS